MALVGSPNVGKSVIFNCLTGRYTTVSNYPGTTVEIARSNSTCCGIACEIIDTPGMYSLMPITEEESVTRRLLCTEKPDLVIHVIDAKHIRRMLPLTLQLIEAGFPVCLTINMMDEAKQLGIRIDITALAGILGIPVVATEALHKKGIEGLKKYVAAYELIPSEKRYYRQFSETIEEEISHISAHLSHGYGLSLRMAAILLLQQDTILQEEIGRGNEGKVLADQIKKAAGSKLFYRITAEEYDMVNTIVSAVLKGKTHTVLSVGDSLGKWTREPFIGGVLVCIVLYFGFYEFVGKFGAGFLVDYIDNILFKQYITPMATNMIYHLVPWDWGRSLLVGEYGIFSMGIRYTLAIILPIVGTFFFMFSILEDCGYLPRLAMLVDGMFKFLGLNGRAVIPIILGFGCGTMAVIVTRTLETKRERLLATFLLSLTIPCSAQLGMVLAILSSHPVGFFVWSIYILIIFLLAGWLSAKVIPGERSSFYLEIPPLRIPAYSNVLTKVYTRIIWYLAEILPVFIITSIILWVFERIGFLPYIIQTIIPVTALLQLPESMAAVFLLGFFRRDYGTAGLYDLCRLGVLSGQQLLVASIVLTLFVPCIAQMAVMSRERGGVASLLMLILIMTVSIASGIFVNWLLCFLPVSI
ncbi:ferrous iron transport protein B [Propionispora sp. 2/2-37]|uniref:ferrous iron transport protein B n=1 Tax=Propionispora sp. 2/2-37 TaxID=1677858 RepID=UPI001F34730C|nr:ferrous iron transport protein B [Propionispora sp. 2/2-37]